MSYLALALTALLALGPVDESGLTDDQKTALAQHFGFGPMQIYKLGPSIFGLRLADLNHDGRTDIILTNAYRSRFELLFQQEPGAAEPAPQTDLQRNEPPDRGNLRIEHIPAATSATWMEVADLTGDNRLDIVYFNEQKELIILPGNEDGHYGPASSIRAPDGNPRRSCFCTGDFNNDGRTDVALLGNEVLAIYHQKDGGGLEPPLRLVHGIDSPMLMLRTDLNGDRRDDLIITADQERYGAFACLQEETNTLAALRPVNVPRARSITLARPADGNGGDDVYLIQYTTNRLKHYRWAVPQQQGVAQDWPQRLHSYPVASRSKQRPLALGDINGDGLVDCLTADPDAAQVILFEGTPGGLGAGVAFPGLLKATDICIADLDRDGKQEVLVASAEENMIGVMRHESGRLSFPTAIPTQGDPFVLTFGSLTADGPADTLFYVAEIDGEHRLVVRPADESKQADFELPELDDDPAALRLADVDQDGRNDLLLFIRFSTPITLRQTDEGTFEVLDPSTSRASLLKEATPAACTLADVTGDAHPEIVLAQGNLARILAVRDGQWTVIDQVHPESVDANITGVAALPDAQQGTMLVLYEQKANELQICQRKTGEAFAVTRTMPVGRFGLTAMEQLPVGTGHAPALLLADDTKLAVLMPHESAPTLVEQQTYETEVKDAFLGDSIVGDLNHDGIRDVAVVDVKKAAIEILTNTPTGELIRAVRFQVFEGKHFSEEPDTYGEPREVLIADVTGDGNDDLVLIVHDRLLVYPGQ